VPRAFNFFYCEFFPCSISAIILNIDSYTKLGNTVLLHWYNADASSSIDSVIRGLVADGRVIGSNPFQQQYALPALVDPDRPYDRYELWDNKGSYQLVRVMSDGRPANKITEFLSNIGLYFMPLNREVVLDISCQVYNGSKALLKFDADPRYTKPLRSTDFGANIVLRYLI
jgi:hypothetical protein